MCEDRYDRQSFLGKDSQTRIKGCTAGIIGLGGGGSHLAQQLAHVGFQNFVLYDPDLPEDSNLNRLIGATVRDVKRNIPKVKIARRIIRGLQPMAKVVMIRECWQDKPLPLRNCDIIFGCVDGYKGRQELEAFSRRHLIPYIDIGIDVIQVDPQPPVLSGQIIASIPGGPCMWCLGFLTEKKLAAEIKRYGDAGHNPQVVWGNGVVASSAVGIAVDLLTGWTGSTRETVYLSYEGNTGQVLPHKRLNVVRKPCPHFPNDQVGEPRFTPL